MSALLALVVAGALTAVPACSCGSDASGEVCEIDEDCVEVCGPNTVPICFEGGCLCADDVPRGRVGQYSSMALDRASAVWVSAYNSTHGDLMVARFAGTGRIPATAWEFIDGVPDGPVVVEGSEVRGGIFAPGDDVGLYTDIAVTSSEVVMVSYFDRTHGSLKFAANYGGVWHSHTVDAGTPEGDPELGYTVVGQYTAITLGSDQRPGIAYFAQSRGAGTLKTEVRFAQATTSEPRGAADWNHFTVDSAELSDSGDGPVDTLTIPYGVGLFVNAARHADDSPRLVYYDRINGNLKTARFDSAQGEFAAPVVLDGGGVDVGWYPGIAIDSDDVMHVSYVSATNDDLLYINSVDNLPEVVDDGYRLVGLTDEGLPKPEFHFIGDDSSVVMTVAGPVIVYQDATWHELLLARRDGNNRWRHHTVAGDEMPFAGAYGFYASSAHDGTDVVMSSWVLDQRNHDAWVEIFRETIVIE